MLPKKENVIEKKLETKPTFKNLINIEKERVPESHSKSKSKSNFKKKSRKKVSALSPPKSNTSLGKYINKESAQNIEEDRESCRRTESQKSVKKSRKNQGGEMMKKIINMKNKVLIIENRFKEEKERRKQTNWEVEQKDQQMKESERIENLKTVHDFLTDYEIQMKRQTAVIKNGFLNQIQEISKNSKVQSEKGKVTAKNILEPSAGMPKLAAKLDELDRIFRL